MTTTTPAQPRPAKRRPKIVCKGFGSWHGYAKGRHWFACGACRWSVK
jgi:hypothetical protein